MAEFYNQDLLAGREADWTGVSDFYVDPGDGKVKVRALLSGDIGNPGQIFLRRVGPDGVPFDYVKNGAKPEILQFNQNIGHIAWQAYEGVDLGFPAERNAQIYTRYRGFAKGALHLQTSGEDRLIIDEYGLLDLTGVASPDGTVPVVVNGRKGRLAIQWDV